MVPLMFEQEQSMYKYSQCTGGWEGVALVEWRVGGHCTGGVVGGRALHWWSGGWEGIALVEWWVGGHCTGGVVGGRALQTSSWFGYVNE